LAISLATNKVVPNGSNKEEHERKLAQHIEKTKLAFEDAVKFLRNEMPEWIK
jgi:hypothetical protein